MKLISLFVGLAVLFVGLAPSLFAQDYSHDYFQIIQYKSFFREGSYRHKTLHRIDFDGQTCSIACDEFNEDESKMAARIYMNYGDYKGRDTIIRPIQILNKTEFWVWAFDEYKYQWQYKRFGDFSMDEKDGITLTLTENGQPIRFLNEYAYRKKYGE